MADTKYKLRYLPLFYEDLEQKVVYIAVNLGNEKAANDLLDAVEKAILERLPVAEAFEPYRSMKERQYPYYRIYVKNYVIYYVVINNGEHKIMEVNGIKYAMLAYTYGTNGIPVTEDYAVNLFDKEKTIYEKMKPIIKKLASDFKFVRVDLYSINGQVKFSELTFSPCSGKLIMYSSLVL